MKKKGTAGFTLVELIVVIAIMGILAGVGTVGYSGYVKNSQKKADMTTIANVVRAIDTAGKSYAFDLEAIGQVSSDGLQVPLGFVLISNEPFDETVQVKDNNGNVIGTDTYQGYTYVMEPRDSNGARILNSNPIDIVLAAAYGEDYGNNIKLVSNQWEEPTSNVPPLYAESSTLYNSVKTLSNTLHKMQNFKLDLDPLGKIDMSARLDQSVMQNGGYKNGAHVVSQVANGIVNKIKSEGEMVDKWIAAAGSSDGAKYAFGLEGMSTEYYTAARRAYNEGMATYVRTHEASIPHSTGEWKKETTTNKWGGTTTTGYTWTQSDAQKTGGSAETHAEAIITCGTGAGELIVSDTFNIKAIETDSYGYEKGIFGWSENKGSIPHEVQTCPACKELCTSYANSEDAKLDAGAFYRTMVTLNAGSEKALSNEADPWKYYDEYIESFSGLYSGLEDVMGDRAGVVITVYYNAETKALTYEVSPATADPRNN